MSHTTHKLNKITQNTKSLIIEMHVLLIKCIQELAIIMLFSLFNMYLFVEVTLSR